MKSLSISGQCSADVTNVTLTWMTTNEAAEYLRTTPKQIRNWVYQGKIKPYKLLGRSLRFRRSDLDSVISSPDIF